MKKVYLHFKEYRLGFLAEAENLFVWVPDKESINLCFNRYDGARDLLFLDANRDTVYEQIPPHFEDFVIGAEREDLMQKANITLSDGNFEKLYKMATLKFINQDFYISI